MHVVTKILIVFGALLSILLSGLAIAYSFNADTLRTAWAAERDAKSAAIADLNSERAKGAADASAVQAMKESLENDKTALATERKNLQSENSTLRAAVAEAKLESDRLKNQSSQQDVTVQLQTKLITTLTAEVTKLRDDMLASSKRETDLVDRLNDLDSQRQVLEQSTRALQEQLQEARLSIEGARGTSGSPSMGVVGAGRPTTGTTTESMGPVVRGRVVQVVKNAAGEELGEIDIGSASGVRVNQRLTIVRDGFIANLIITRVELNSAIGRIEKLGRKVEVMGGDVVLSRVD